jgi:hypothetical protein
MLGGLKRIMARHSQEIEMIRWARDAAKTPGHELENPGLREIRAMQAKAADRTQPKTSKRMGEIVAAINADPPRRLPSRSTRLDRFDGETIDITPNP